MLSFQRALLHGKAEDDLLELPSGYKMPELTEEQLKRRQLRAKKRREQAMEKQEKDKVILVKLIKTFALYLSQTPNYTIFCWYQTSVMYF